MGGAAPFIAMGASVLGAGASMFGQAQQAGAQADAARYQAQVERNNAILSRQKQELTGQIGEVKATNQGLQNRTQQAKLRASIGASGVDPNSGSAAEVQAGAAMLGGLDVATVRSNTARELWGYQVEESNATGQAALQEQKADNIEDALPWQLLGSFLSGLSSVGSQWSGYQMASAPAAGGAGG